MSAQLYLGPLTLHISELKAQEYYVMLFYKTMGHELKTISENIGHSTVENLGMNERRCGATFCWILSLGDIIEDRVFWAPISLCS